MTVGSMIAQQQALVAALADRSAPAADLVALPGVEGGTARGLQAYRVNAQALSAKALAAVFPQVQADLGEASFEAMAWAFWRSNPPEQGDLAQWGGCLTDFLAAQAGMDDALVDRAQLAWALHQAENATDVELDALSLGLLAEVEAAELRLRLRPGVQVLHPLASGPRLVWRKGWRAHSAPLTAGDAALMQALLAGRSLESALDGALAADDEFDFSAWLQAALRESWLFRAERT